MSKVAFITGINGQIGHYLAELLLNHDYVVHGMVRYSSQNSVENNTNNSKLVLHYGDMTDGSRLRGLIFKIQPDEVYNLAGISSIKVSSEMPEYTAQVIAMGTLVLLETCRNLQKKVKIFQASSCDMLDQVRHWNKQDEDTRYTQNGDIHATSKIFAYEMARNYRKTYGMHIVCGILFHHTSPRRGDIFSDQKIVSSAINILHGHQKTLCLDNLCDEYDIGHTKDYVRAIWLAMLEEEPNDYVISTGKSVSVKTLVTSVFQKIGLDLTWTGRGIAEEGWNQGRKLVIVNENYDQSNTKRFCGNSEKIGFVTDWKPFYTLDSILSELVDQEYRKFIDSNTDYTIKKIEKNLVKST